MKDSPKSSHFSVHQLRFPLLLAALAIPVACGDDDSNRGGGPQGGGGTGATSGSGGNQSGTGGNTPGTGGSSGGTTGDGGSSGDGGSTSGGMGGMGGGSGDDVEVVFDDDYGDGIGFVQFGGSTNALSIDTDVKHSGDASLKVEVPGAGYTGGALVATLNRDLSQYDALVFWARASAPHTLNTTGFGNNATGGVSLQTERVNLELTTEWQEFVIPLPSPDALTSEVGLFHFAEGAEAEPYTIWFDDIRYESLGTIGDPQPAIATETRDLTVGGTFTVPGTAATFSVDDENVTVTVAPAYFDFTSSDEAVATVDGSGLVTGVAEGTAEISAELAGVSAAGLITVNVSEATAPEEAAPAPSHDEADVISLFSDAYTNVTVDTWSADWDQADVANVSIEDNACMLYTNLNFAGIEFTSSPIDATEMTHLHFHVWLPTATVFRVKLVNFADGAYDPATNTEFEIELADLEPQTWHSLSFPLADFMEPAGALDSREFLAQMILTSAPGATVYIDNVYFYDDSAN